MSWKLFDNQVRIDIVRLTGNISNRICSLCKLC